jgi:hypothetical protein
MPSAISNVMAILLDMILSVLSRSEQDAPSLRRTLIFKIVRQKYRFALDSIAPAYSRIRRVWRALPIDAIARLYRSCSQSVFHVERGVVYS